MDDEVLVDEATEIFPRIGKLFYAGMMHQLQNLGCSLGQMKVMGHLYTYGRGTISEVATSVGVSLPTASELVEQLDDKGWVERKANPADRRQVVVELTPQARAHAEELHEIRRQQVRAALMRLEPEERPVFVRSLKALADVLGDSVAQPADAQLTQQTSRS